MTARKPDAVALFERLGEWRFRPTELARGPWSQDALHGGPPAALLGGAAEPLLEGLHPARVTVELLRPVPVGPLDIRAEVVRPGRKVRLVRAALAADGNTVATATVVGIRTAEIRLPHLPLTDGAVPPLPSDGKEPPPDAGWTAFHFDGVEHRIVAGGWGDPGPCTDWIRLRVPVVAGEEPSPLQRVLAAADFGNGISGVADFSQLAYINPDLTVYLQRLPADEWVCLDAVSRLEPIGLGLAESELWDRNGRLGRSVQSLLVEERE